MDTSMLKKRKKRHVRSGTEEAGEASFFGALLRSLVVFFAVTALFSVIAALFTYLQKDPDQYLFTGTVCPYLGAAAAGFATSKLAAEKSLLASALCGMTATLLLWLLSAFVPSESSSGVMQAILSHLGVAVCAVLGSFLGKIRPTANPRRRKHKRY